MTAADFASLRQTLEQVAERLSSAPDAIEIQAISYEQQHPNSRYPYQVGALSRRCHGEADVIRSIIKQYLTHKSGCTCRTCRGDWI